MPVEAATISTESLKTQADALFTRGIRNLWYPVLPSWGVREKAVGITRLSEDIVLWRDRHGNLSAVEDRCPHRGAKLSLGWNLGDRIACWYHGVEVNGLGVVVDVPAVNACPLVGQKCARSYPVREEHGAIFLYFGDELNPEPCELNLPQELTSPEYSNFLTAAMWKCNYRYPLDNVMDPMHGSYLHSSSHSMAEGDKQADMRVRRTPTGVIFEKTGQRGVNFDWTEYGESGAAWMRLEIPYRKKFGPGGGFTIVGFCTPIDEDHCEVFFWRIRKVEGWQRDVWRFLYKNRLEGLHWNVLEQDRIVLENMAPNARSREFLYQHDVGLTWVRRMLMKRAEQQVVAVAAAKAFPQPEEVAIS